MKFPRSTLTLSERMWARVEVRDPVECWLWKGRVHTEGYGIFDFSTRDDADQPKVRRIRAHRFIYEEKVGSIPAGKVVDHICRTRLCVNPSHLRAVSVETNALENSGSPVAGNAHKTHCVHGHEFNERNTRYQLASNGRYHRQCRECFRARREIYKVHGFPSKRPREAE